MVEQTFESARARLLRCSRLSPYAGHMVLSARDIAVELRSRRPGVGTVKLHKLLYYCQGHHLATFGVPLFRDTISAWDMGPVVGALWRTERDGAPESGVASFGEAELNTVGYVVSRYGALSGTDLRHLTHSERPWREADRRRTPGKSVRIPTEAIREYFASAALEDDDESVPPLDADDVAAWLEGAEERFAQPARRDSVEELRSRVAHAR